MLNLFKFFLEKIDILKVAEALRKRQNRKVSAHLHLILDQAYEIIELYQLLLDELRAALECHHRIEGRDQFYLNPYRVNSLLNRQASNLEVMSTMTFDLMDELRILDNAFVENYLGLCRGKWGILFETQHLLSEGRLPIGEGDPLLFPANESNEYRTLWFPREKPSGDRAYREKYLHGWDGREKTVIDVSLKDGERFFREVAFYFEKEDPIAKLAMIRGLTEKYREVLLQNFSIEDLWHDIGKVRKYQKWTN